MPSVFAAFSIVPVNAGCSLTDAVYVPKDPRNSIPMILLIVVGSIPAFANASGVIPAVNPSGLRTVAAMARMVGPTALCIAMNARP